MFLFLCGLEERVSQMLSQCWPHTEVGGFLYVGLYLLLLRLLCWMAEALEVKLLNCMCADVGLPAVSEPLMGVKEVRNMVQLVLCILDEPYSK